MAARKKPAKKPAIKKKTNHPGKRPGNKKPRGMVAKPKPAPKNRKKPRGYPEFKPTLEQQVTVKAMVGYGVPHIDVCEVIINPYTGNPISTTTLHKYFKPQLRRGKVIANSTIAQSLYNRATQGGRQDVTAMIFWLKCRAGWKETAEPAGVGISGVLMVPATELTQQWEKQQELLNAKRLNPLEAAGDARLN